MDDIVIMTMLQQQALSEGLTDLVSDFIQFFPGTTHNDHIQSLSRQLVKEKLTRLTITCNNGVVAASPNITE